MLVGGDIVHRAFANTMKRNTPVAILLSFGWVAYAFKSLTQTQLYPTTELSGFFINTSNGYAQPNHSWSISRLLHVYPREKRWELDEENDAMAMSIVKIKEKAPTHGLLRSCWRF